MPEVSLVSLIQRLTLSWEGPSTNSAIAVIVKLFCVDSKNWQHNSLSILLFTFSSCYDNILQKDIDRNKISW